MNGGRIGMKWVDLKQEKSKNIITPVNEDYKSSPLVVLVAVLKQTNVIALNPPLLKSLHCTISIDLHYNYIRRPTFSFSGTYLYQLYQQQDIPLDCCHLKQ